LCWQRPKAHPPLERYSREDFIGKSRGGVLLPDGVSLPKRGNLAFGGLEKWGNSGPLVSRAIFEILCEGVERGFSKNN